MLRDFCGSGILLDFSAPAPARFPILTHAFLKNPSTRKINSSWTTIFPPVRVCIKYFLLIALIKWIVCIKCNLAKKYDVQSQKIFNVFHRHGHYPALFFPYSWCQKILIKFKSNKMFDMYYLFPQNLQLRFFPEIFCAPFIVSNIRTALIH